MSPGYFDPVTATHAYRNGVIVKFGDDGLNLFTAVSRLSIAGENHVALTTGPNTAGWGVSGAGKILTRPMDTDFPFAIPLYAKNLYVRVRNRLQNNAGATANQTMLVTVSNPGILEPFVTIRTDVDADVTNPSIQYRESYSFVPISSVQRTITIYVEWPNVNPALTSTFIAADVYGYTV